MMYWSGEWSWVAWLGMTALMILFWGGVAWVVLAVVRGSTSSPPRSPEQVLDERLASGEITVEEYESRRRALRDSRESGSAS